MALDSPGRSTPAPRAPETTADLDCARKRPHLSMRPVSWTNPAPSGGLLLVEDKDVVERLAIRAGAFAR